MIFYAALAMSSAVVSLGTAVFVVVHEKPSLVRASLLLGLVMVGIESALSGASFLAVSAAEIMMWQKWRLLAMGLAPAAWLVFSLSYARGEYRANIRTWRAILTLSMVLPVALVSVAWPALFEAIHAGTNGHAALIEHGMPATLVHALFILVSVLAIMNIERTFRAATGIMRWRIKFMVVGVIMLLAIKIYISTLAILYSSLDLSLDGLNAGGLILCEILILCSLTRTHLLTVALYPAKHGLHRSFTMIAAALYLLTVGIMGHVATNLGLVRGFPLRALILFVTLIGISVLAISDRVRQTVKRTLSRQFGRPMYNCRKVWTDFTNRTTACTSTPQLAQAVARMVSDTFEILSVTVWIVDDAKQTLTFGASTSLAEAEAQGLARQRDNDGPIIDALRRLTRPIDLADARGQWAADVQRSNPLRFPERGQQLVCVPLATGESLLGMMVLADRVRGVRYTYEEMDLLKTIGEQVGAKLLNLRLSARLLEAKQMEAFQAMSAFFVHDLKNTSSTLSLMLQNLPKHFGNPTFREDALAAISKSVRKINELIERLTTLRQSLEIVPADTDLNRLVDQTLSPLEPSRQIRIEQAPGDLPRLPIDPDQFQKVLTNLLINAADATAQGGSIQVRTERQKSWAVLTVRDTGCGMSRDFMQTSLFRPFRSTKQAGMGIGLFHSKMIVEAHHGRLEVESQQGEGSTFKVWLPIPKEPS